jgi:hypothetical protein
MPPSISMVAAPGWVEAGVVAGCVVTCATRVASFAGAVDELFVATGERSQPTMRQVRSVERASPMNLRTRDLPPYL